VMYALLVVASRFAPETRARTLEQINETTEPVAHLDTDRATTA
jgi:MFS transporter, putative metabolite:H+ symporter